MAYIAEGRGKLDSLFVSARKVGVMEVTDLHAQQHPPSHPPHLIITLPKMFHPREGEA